MVQLYAGAPNGKLEKTEATLVAFGKTRLLQPGESETLSFTINASDLASFDEAASAWIIEPGSYSLKVGASSLKIHQTASFEVDSEMNVGQVSKALAPQRSFDRLSSN